jgi:hypothetical protein
VDLVLDELKEDRVHAVRRRDGDEIDAVRLERDLVELVVVEEGRDRDPLEVLIPSSVRMVLRATAGFRIPEPVRRADRLSRAAAKGLDSSIRSYPDTSPRERTLSRAWFFSGPSRFQVGDHRRALAPRLGMTIAYRIP